METVSLHNDSIRIEVVPELGCKIVSIYDIKNEHEWLRKDVHRPLRKAEYGNIYLDFDISGFDECFPNIGVSRHPLDSTLTLPDHGDLWSIPWSITTDECSLGAHVKGRSFPYNFSRRFQLEGSRIFFDYEIQNMGNSDFVYMWSAHPLFNISGDMRIHISEPSNMTKEFGFGGRLGPDGLNGYLGQFQMYKWPLVHDQQGKEIDLSYVSLSNPVTDKVVLNSPVDGKIALEDLESGRCLTLKISPTEIPFVGICYNLGAFPFDNNPGTWVAIEPTTGCTDKLDDSFARGATNSLKHGERKRWSYEIELR